MPEDAPLAQSPTDSTATSRIAALRQAAQRLQAQPLREGFTDPTARHLILCKQAGPIVADFTKQRLDAPTLQHLTAWAREQGFEAQRTALFAGAMVNTTEQRPALHPALRGSGTHTILTATLRQQTEAMLHVAERLRTHQWPGLHGAPVNSLLCLGIGGSDLGPRLVHDALSNQQDFKVRFVANVDPDELDRTLLDLDPTRTAVAIISKTFTTRETLANAAAVQAWLRAAKTGIATSSSVMLAITAQPERARAWGIIPAHILPFDEAIGGRFSLWSSAGIGIAAGCGSQAFLALHAGAACIDRHFQDTPLPDNLPALLGLISVWNRTFLGYPTQAIVPYAERLRLFPAWLQQLVMESNGKSVDRSGQPCGLSTAPIIWGGTGTNAQHAFFQHLHQGQDIIPVDLIIARRAHAVALFPGDDRHRILVANCLAQSAALAFGHSPHPNEPHRVLPGGRPNTVLMLPTLDAYSLGALLACYEHATFTAASVLGINPFDQFGVEYGKVMSQAIEHLLAGHDSPDIDPATRALARQFA